MNPYKYNKMTDTNTTMDVSTTVNRTNSEVMDVDTDFSRESLIEAIKVFDKDGNGLMAVYEFRHIMTHIGDKMTETQIDQVIREADVDDNGCINYTNFIDMMLARKTDD